MLEESLQLKIKELVQNNLNDYVAWQKSSNWDEGYKWTTLYAIKGELSEYDEVNINNVEQVLEIYERNNPQTGSLLRYTYFDDLKSMLIQKEDAAKFFQEIWNANYELADEIYKKYSHLNRSLGTPTIAYIAAGRHPEKLPLFRGELFDGLTTVLGLSFDIQNNSDRYRIYTQITEIIQKEIIGKLLELGYEEQFIALPALCAQDFLFFKFFDWQNNRIIWLLEEFINQAKNNAGKSAKLADFTTLKYKIQYQNLPTRASFGLGGIARTPWLSFGYGDKYGFFPTFLFYPERNLLLLAFDNLKNKKPVQTWQNVDKYPTIIDYFKSLGVPEEEIGLFHNSRVYKSYDTSEKLPKDVVEDLKTMINIYKNQLTNLEHIKSLIPKDLQKLADLVREFLEQNPNFIAEQNPNQEQMNAAIEEFQSKFSPSKLAEFSDEEVLRYIPFNLESNNDTLSYYLEFHKILRDFGGIGGWQCGKDGLLPGERWAMERCCK